MRGSTVSCLYTFAIGSWIHSASRSLGSCPTFREAWYCNSCLMPVQCWAGAFDAGSILTKRIYMSCLSCLLKITRWTQWIIQKYFSALTLYPQNYSIWIFTHLKLCLADAIHNFKWVKIIQIWQNEGQLFSDIVDWCHIWSLTCLNGGTLCANKKWKPEYMRHRRLKS